MELLWIPGPPFRTACYALHTRQCIAMPREPVCYVPNYCPYGEACSREVRFSTIIAKSPENVAKVKVLL